jgi:tRNA nucleotidyltransferase/poly(A) polymerase
MSKKIAERLRLSRKDSERLFRLIRYHMFTVSEIQTDSAVRRFIKNVGLENVDDMMAIRTADRLGGGTPTGTSWRTEEFKKRIRKVLEKPFSISDLKINGSEVMEILEIKPGPKVGEILNNLFAEVQEDHTKNNREYLLGRVKEFK